MSIAENLRKYRLQAGLTQAQVAKRLGVRAATVSDWERGVNKITAEDLEMFADACGVEPGLFYSEPISLIA